MKRYYINYMHGGSIESSKCQVHTKLDEFDWDKCTGYNKLPDVLPPVKRIIAIGDTHGDIRVTLESLKLAKVIDYDDRNISKITINDPFDWIKWVANPSNTIVVQVGDQIDNCRPMPNKKDNCVKDNLPDILVFKVFDKINELAMKEGGAVYSLLGNHEIMNVMGDLNYVSKSGFDYFSNYIDPNNNKNFDNGISARKYAFRPGNEYAKYLACTRQTALIIGSNLFVHAGILPGLAKQYNIIDINKLIRQWLLNEIHENTHIDGVGQVKDLLGSYTVSPFWPRLLGDLPNNINIDDEKCADLIQTLKCYNIGSMIIGHTPQFYKNHSGINDTCSGKIDGQQKQVWRIDVGASNAFDIFDSEDDSRNVQVLEIIDDNKFRIIK